VTFLLVVGGVYYFVCIIYEFAPMLGVLFFFGLLRVCCLVFFFFFFLFVVLVGRANKLTSLGRPSSTNTTAATSPLTTTFTPTALVYEKTLPFFPPSPLIPGIIPLQRNRTSYRETAPSSADPAALLVRKQRGMDLKDLSSPRISRSFDYSSPPLLRGRLR